MRLPLHIPPDSLTESEVKPSVLPRDRTTAVTALFEAHYASLVRMARLMVDDRETAEDVVMDAFTSFYRRWTAVRDPDEAYRYVRSCVLNGGRSQLRRRRLRRRHESGSPQRETAREGLETNEADRSTMTQLLATLPYRQRQVLVLRYFVDMTEAQIAYELGVSPGIVPGMPDVTRDYKRFTDVVDDTIDARVYLGIHFREADVQGAGIGKKVARWLDRHYFQRVM